MPSSAVKMRCSWGVERPNLAGMARNTVYRGGWTAVSKIRCAGRADRREVPERVQEPLAVGHQAGLGAVEELVVDAEPGDAGHDRSDDVPDAPDPGSEGDEPEARQESPGADHGAER